MRQAGPALQAGLNARTTDFVGGLNEYLQELEVPLRIEHFSSLFLARFARDRQFSSLFYFHLRDQGVHITEGRAAFLSTAHSDADIERIDAAYRTAARAMKQAGFLSSGSRPSSRSEIRELPVTEGQQEILLAAAQSAEANCSYNLANTLHITGPIDVGVLQRAIGRVIARHEALRVTFTIDLTRQRIAPDLTVDAPLLDLSELDDEAREAALEEHRAAEVETPFDLQAGPLVRVLLLRAGPEEHHLFLTVHHAVCDGWSSGTLLRDLTAAYTAESRGVAVDPPPAMQLSEYVDWFDRYRTSEGRGADERFWSEHVDGDFPTTDVPPDRPRPARRSHRADRRTLRLDADLIAGLRRLAAEEGSTLFGLLLGSFECLLARLTGSAEVGVGVSIAGHTQFPGRDLVAHCINLLPLRRAVDFNSSFSDHLATTQAAFLDAFDHQNLSYGAIVRNSGVRRDPARTPLVSTTFNMDSPAGPLDMDGAVAVPGSSPRRFENFDLFVNVVPDGDELIIECTHSVDLFDPGTIDRRIEGWATMLASLARSGAGIPVGELDVVPARELELLTEWNATRMERDEATTLVSLFRDAVERNASSIAVEFGERQVSYRELGELAARVARRLVDAGVGRGAMVGILCERSVELVASVHGVLMAGGAYVPLEPEHPAERTRHIVAETEMKVVLCQDRFRHLMSEREVLVVDVQELLAGNGDEEPMTLAPVDPDDVAYVMYTSGSTGRPKGVANRHRGVVNQALSLDDRIGLGPADVVLHKTAFGFDPSVRELFWPLLSGARLVVAAPGEHRDPLYLIETTVRHGVTVIAFVPSMLRLFLDQPGARSCTSLRTVTCGGEALTRDLQDRFFSALPNAALYNLYGPTEAAVQVTAWRCRRDDALAIVPIGAPMANTSIHILDDRMRRVPIGVPGEIYIGGVQVAAGYVNREDLTAARFIADPFDPEGRLYRTGDQARWLPDGQIDFIGRMDHQVKVRGMRIELGEIEAVLAEHPAVLEAAVTLRDDASGEPTLAAYVLPRSGSTVEATEARDHLKRLLPRHMIPSSFTVLDTPPLTSSGKLDRRALPSPEQVDAESNGAYVAPRTDIEHEIAAMWSDVLGIDQVGTDTDFFDLGGHSLKLMQLAARIDQALGVRPSLASLFEFPTVADHAVLVTEALMVGGGADDEALAEVLADLSAGVDLES